MRGGWVSAHDLRASCTEVVANADLGEEQRYSVAEREAKAEADSQGQDYTMTPLPDDAPAIPCGLTARSFFNDRYELYKLDDQGNMEADPIEIDETGIAWEWDIGDDDYQGQFKNIAEKPEEPTMYVDQATGEEAAAEETVGTEEVNWKEVQWLDMEDEHFIVWMRNSGLPNFQKLWGHADGLTKGKYQLRVQSNYDLHQFQGRKSFVIA